MRNENGKTDDHDEPQGTELEAASTGDEPTGEPTQEQREAAARAVEQKFELMVNVAMLSIMTLLRLIKAKGPEAIGEAEMQQFEQLRQSVDTAIEAVDEMSQSEELQAASIDLRPVRRKLDLVVQRLDDFPIDEIELDSTPPS